MSQSPKDHPEFRPACNDGVRVTASEVAGFVRDRLPPGGLFAGQTWLTALGAFKIDPEFAAELEHFGRILLQFNRAVNLLYRQSAAGKQPGWIAHWLDIGKPAELIALQRDAAFKNDIPRVIRPDIILAEDGWYITELDAVPGGMGLTAWLNMTYSELPGASESPRVIGGATGMVQGFHSIFPQTQCIHIVVSEEAAMYKPEMEWLAAQVNANAAAEICHVRSAAHQDFQPGDAVYRFFELFDLPNLPNARAIFDLARSKRVFLTPPPKPLFEEKMLFALLWNRNLRDFWRQELGNRFFSRLIEHVPCTWVVDPTPLPPHAAIPNLNITNWNQLASFSQREKELVLKVSGFSPLAWGARSVSLGSDMSRHDWSAAVTKALESFSRSPYVLQRYHKPRIVQMEWFDFDKGSVIKLDGRARLCPYYFVTGEGDNARAVLSGVLATVCPADKKIVHGMSDAVLAPVAVRDD